MARPGRLSLTWCSLLSVAVGCARGPEAPRSSAPSASTSAGATSRPPSTALALDARYADLVRTAGALEGAARDASGCLLAVSPGGFALRAELAPAVRPLPQPPTDLETGLTRAQSVEILSAWGRYGDGSGQLALAAFTDAAPTRSASALFLTSRGVHLRPASGAPGPALDAPDLASALRGLPRSEDHTLFVTAEAGMPVAALAGALDELGKRALRVALAVSLASDTKLPVPPRAEIAPCPDGLPATDAPEGSLPAAALAAGIAPLREHASDCLDQGNARGAAGGRIALAIRVGASGRVQEACATRDDVGDPGVLACVLDLARKLSFAPPAPSGVIDLGLPVVLLPASRPAQRPLCSDS